jgi:NAD(P)-dependent dehydrogenase (short-subunit alcohol dehydrogenase family)
MSVLQGKRFVVTGAATGMGAATVVAYARAGARVVGWRRNRGAEAVEGALSDEERGRVTFLRCDVSDAAEVARGMQESAEILGGLDGLANAAGVVRHGPAEEIAPAEWEELFAINARGTYLTNQAAFQHLRKRGGRIINFASAAGVSGMANSALYAATKGAVLAWTRTVAREWGRYGITVNAVAPAIWTPMYEETRAQMTPEELAQHDAAVRAVIPLGGKLGDPERDFAPMMVFLASDGAGFLTGQTYCIDGGALMLS